MNTGSSNSSSVTSLDLETEREDVAEKPLSPVLSSSKVKKRFFHKKGKDRKYKQTLQERFNERIAEETQNNQMKLIDMNEQQHRQYYSLLCDKRSLKEHEVKVVPDHRKNRRSSPIAQNVHQMSRECTLNETVINYQCQENLREVRFSTAGGREIELSGETLEKGSVIFEDIIGSENDNSFYDCSVLKNPTTSKKVLSKIPILNQQTSKNTIKTTVEHFQVDCYEDVFQNNTRNLFVSAPKQNSNEDKNEKYSNNLKKILANKYNKQSTSSDNDEYHDSYSRQSKEIYKKDVHHKRDKQTDPFGLIQKDSPYPRDTHKNDNKSVDPNKTTTSKNMVLTMKPTSIIELHRNKNFNPSNDSEDCDFAQESENHIDKSEDFFGFTQKDREESKKASIRVNEAIQNAIEMEKRRRKKKKACDKTSKENKNDLKYRSVSSNRDKTQEKVFPEKSKKRKGPESPPFYAELVNGSQTIELSPNQKKFKIEIDCNSKFRINISCGESETPTTTTESDCNKVNLLKNDKSDNSPSSDLHEPKGKLIKKFINKAQQFYRDIRKSDTNLAETEKKNKKLEENQIDTDGFKIPHAVNKEVNIDKKSPHISNFGFKTAGGKDIKLSEKALKNATEMYESTTEKQNTNFDLVKTNNKKCELKVDITKQQSQFSNKSNGGFQTVAGKEIKFSEKTLKKAKEMFDSINDKDIIQEKSNNEKTKNKKYDFKNPVCDQKCFQFSNESFPGFQTAGGKEVKISDKTLKKAKEMYTSTNEKHDIHTDSEKEKCDVRIDLNNQQSQFSTRSNFEGFKTAGGKEIKYSENTLKKAKEMYDSINTKEDIEKLNSTETNKKCDIKIEVNVNPQPQCSINSNVGGFQTAAGKKVELSENALMKAKQMYDCQNEIRDTNCDMAKLKDKIIHDFKNKQFPESNLERLQPAIAHQLRFPDKTKPNREDTNKYEKADCQLAKESDRFKTTGGKEIKHLEKNPKKAKDIHDCEKHDTEEPQKTKCRSNSPTGYENNLSGKTNKLKKKETISNVQNEEKQSENVNLKNSKNKSGKHSFEIITNEPCIIKPTFNMKSCGFVSASGKNLFLSEKGLLNARKIYETTEKDLSEFEFQNPILKSEEKENCNSNLESNFTLSKSKPKNIFDESPFQAGDSENNKNSIENETFPAMYPQSSYSRNLCMGDFLASSDNVSTPSQQPEGLHFSSPSTETLTAKQSKKTVQLLEDVFETVNNAIESIDNKYKKPYSISRKRLGMSKYKQIQISPEKLERAKLLFDEDFNTSFENIKEVTRPIIMSQNSPSASIMSSFRNQSSYTQGSNAQKTYAQGSLQAKGSPYQSPSFVHRSSSIGNHSPLVAGQSPSYTHQSSSLVHRSPSILQRSSLTSTKTQYSLDSLTSPTLLSCEKTKGTIDDWFGMIDNKMEWMKMQLKDLEDKKTYLNYQKDVLEKSKNEAISPQPGILIRKKEHIKLQLKDLKPNVSSPDNISELILSITPENADDIHFTHTKSSDDALNNYSTLDGALVVPNVHNIIGYTEIEMAFKTMKGVDLKLLPNRWIENHYKWIVWKLASYERFLTGHLRGCLNVENVMQQLKYRYDREIDKAERSALRKILEMDDIPQKRMVCCVSNVEKSDQNEIELTDGWYSIGALIDRPLSYEVGKRKIKVGTKLITTGVSLLNCTGCHPLDAPSDVKLKLNYNSTRRAHWYSKLGYQRCSKPLLIPLHSIHSEGGMIGCVKIYVVRVYPLRYMEQIDHSKVWRNFKAEERRIREFEIERLNKMEKVHFDVQKQYELEMKEERKKNIYESAKVSKSELLKVTCPKTLLSILESSNDPDDLMEYLTPSQRADVLEYRQTQCIKIQNELSKRITEEMKKLKLIQRKVVSILKLLVLDATCESNKPYYFCVSNPSEEHLTLLKEYKVYYVYNIMPRYNGELFSTNTTYFKLDKEVSRNKYKRQAYPIELLLDSHCHPPFNEFDTVGVVVYLMVTDEDQSFWLADFLGNLLFVRVRDGPRLCRLLDDIARGDVVMVQNLIYNPPQGDFGFAIANQFTVVSKSIQNDSIEKFKIQLPDDLNQFLAECTSKIEKSAMKLKKLPKENDVSVLQCGLGKVVDDSSEESSTIPQRLTPTEIAMSTIDIDQFM